ncbi:hypothetical protein WME91_23345 [Sorangium sp. So ce269]
MTVKNTRSPSPGENKPTSWGVVIGLNGSTLNNAWNVRVTPSEGQFTAINEGYNALKPGESTMWGFCGSGTGRPSLVSVNGPEGSTTTTSASSSSSSSTSASSGGGEGGATGTGGAGGEGGGTTTTTAGTGGEGGGTTTTTTAGAGGEGGGTTTTTTTTAGAGGEGGEGGGTTTTTTTTTAGAGGEGGGTTTATTTTTAGVGGAGGEGGGTTTATTTTAGVGGAGGAGGEGGGSSSDPACGPDTAAFADVRPILAGSCAGCHGGPAGAAGLDLRAAMAVGALVSQDARSCSSEHALVVPFMPSSSYLMNKLNDADLCDPDESAMPPGAPLSADDIKTINDWICAGAPAD